MDISEIFAPFRGTNDAVFITQTMKSYGAKIYGPRVYLKIGFVANRAGHKAARGIRAGSSVGLIQR